VIPEIAARIAKATHGEIIIAHIKRQSGAGVVTGIRELQRSGASFRRLDQLGPTDVDYAVAAGPAAVASAAKL